MAQAPRLKIAIADYGRTRALKSGAVPINGIEADFVRVAPIIGAFRRMVRDLEFDVCEMAPTTYTIARALGAPFVALPVFLMRHFHHGGFVVRAAAKQPYLDALKTGAGDSPEDRRYRGFRSLMSDPLPYGMAANRASIEALVTYSLQQKLIPSWPQLDQVFVAIDP